MIAYGCEMQALKKLGKKKIAAAEIKFMRRAAGVTLRDRVRYEIITSEPGSDADHQKDQFLLKKLGKTRRMDGGNKIAKKDPSIQSVDRRSRGRPKEKLIGTLGSLTAQQTGQIA